MAKNYSELLKQKLDAENFNKLTALNNPAVIDFVGEYVELCTPQTVFVRTDSARDRDYIRKKSLTRGEEKALSLKGQTIHFDGYLDQARDKANTRYLVAKSAGSGKYLNSTDRAAGLSEVRGLLKNIMAGEEMLVCFFSLGPLNSPFSILAVQITDSFYVAHSEDILYRPGYEEFKKQGGGFFKLVHSAGELTDNVSRNTGQRRIYIDLENQLVYSVNTQYAGNTVGLKKLSLRLAIKKAVSEGWLAEHMFLMGVNDFDNKKKYFCGAYPSMCGKTSTAMLPGESIVGDDIIYLRAIDGQARAVNVERGIFGIIKGINPEDDEILFKSLEREGEIIFSNVLVDEKGTPFWTGKGSYPPAKGANYAGEWFPGKTDREGNEIPPSHKNARFTIRLSELGNVDENLERPDGVKISGIIYGGRDSDTSVPVEEALSWRHGIIVKAASLESETTAATLGQEGVRVFNPMSNMDFLSVLLGDYLTANLNFERALKEPPLIFSVNYFLRDKHGKFLNAMQDKRVWFKWIRLRAEQKAQALLTPTGLIPLYADLKMLFKQVLEREYSEQEYVEQFTLRIPENLAKIERIINIYQKLAKIPPCLFEELQAQVARLKDCRKKHGDYVNPLLFAAAVKE